MRASIVEGATALAGLIAVPINFRLSGKEFQYVVENSEAKAFIVQDELTEVVESVRADGSREFHSIATKAIRLNELLKKGCEKPTVGDAE